MSVEHVLLAHLEARRIPHCVLEHPICRTSVESAVARAAAGAAGAVGAKALVVVTGAGCVMLVLPGMRRLDSKRARALIGKFRFARPDEVAAATGGLKIGTIPPFGRSVLPGIARLIVDREIVGSETIGFNAACLTRSVVMPGNAYADAAEPDCIDTISLAAEEEPAAM